jgi:virginiamycin B lyase
MSVRSLLSLLVVLTATVVVVFAADVRVVVKEWTVPTENSRPHDPLVAPDGSIWYTGQWANVLGRFDPNTAGAVRSQH